jgi:GTPase Era involved in 16S rRNA processing
MVSAAWGGAKDADFSLLVVDAKSGLTDAVRAIAAKLKESPRRLWLALNKVDLVPREQLLPLAAELHGLLDFSESFMISAEKSQGLDRLRAKLAEAMPPGPWMFPEDELSDLPNRMLAAEVVREQILRQTHEEVPHHATVETSNGPSARRQRPGGLHDLCRPRDPEGDPDRRWRGAHQGDRPQGAAGADGAAGPADPPVPQREGQTRLG